ncbi:hypothetical protein HJC10_30030 [Corallococcus exiguus]|uniref:hypothetical protein n=1 Tax=Corallococcus TaxID=83461 RepID=UPI000ECDA5B7|nr:MULTISPECIES: hypothetical protein [Corallococcus]NNB90376.1 hypothetical protein [Corallococcus exiguus]NNB97616.1 hypothetical protein [Corallococcus exiguus]NNC07075.1 hypothetical protein [Corallococcus exiguus]NPC50914.1 hypothetical protein [Corallococcus exiguus]RKH77094.1 hypothetical protein D7X99_32855 [Corallococcus sp. AB032C]
MRSTALRMRASMLLAATLLPFSALADTVYLQLTDVGSEVDSSGLTAATVAERTRYGIEEALKTSSTQAILMDPQHEGAPDVTVSAKVTRAGEKYRLTYQLTTTHAPVRTKTLSYDFANPSLSDKGSVVMAQAVLTEAEKLEAAGQETPVATGTDEVPLAQADAPMAEGLGQDSTGRELESEAPRRRGRGQTNLDLGLALGFNSPSGIFGGELEYRVTPILGLNLSAGTGAWGFRVGPVARLYPLGEVRTSPFLEAGMSFNMGTTSTTTLTFGDESEVYTTEKLFTPVATLAVGMRQSMGPMYLGLRAGWGFRLREDNWTTSDGRDPNLFDALDIGTSQHGGFLASVTLGVTLF